MEECRTDQAGQDDNAPILFLHFHILSGHEIKSGKQNRHDCHLNDQNHYRRKVFTDYSPGNIRHTVNRDDYHHGQQPYGLAFCLIHKHPLPSSA